MNSNLIKIALSEAIKKSCLERFEICKRISELAGRKITVGMHPIAFEVKARTEEYIKEGSAEITLMGARLWVNTLSQTPEKAAGHIDRLPFVILMRIGGGS